MNVPIPREKKCIHYGLDPIEYCHFHGEWESIASRPAVAFHHDQEGIFIAPRKKENPIIFFCSSAGFASLPMAIGIISKGIVW